MLEGFAYCKVLFEDGKPQDFVYLDVNEAHEKLTGLKDVIGKKVTEVVPGIRESNPEIFEIYGRVASTGNPERLRHTLIPWDVGFLHMSIAPNQSTPLPCLTILPTASETRSDLRRAKKDIELLSILFHKGFLSKTCIRCMSPVMATLPMIWQSRRVKSPGRLTTTSSLNNLPISTGPTTVALWTLERQRASKRTTYTEARRYGFIRSRHRCETEEEIL